ncbi:CotD family spore coat protein [Litoribacterium kuwaitense]|uniref:CotD family spore coat protein n=1 Tax=Litoribacterium kuwaitense TaxID=1398745 RepID=UPI001FEC7361|nr:CotD family spore coat protein [Litoribacterium kuwaitense]
MQPIVHPTRQVVENQYVRHIVPHIHPVHTEYRQHNMYEHRHYYPQTVSNVADANISISIAVKCQKILCLKTVNRKADFVSFLSVLSNTSCGPCYLALRIISSGSIRILAANRCQARL